MTRIKLTFSIFGDLLDLSYLNTFLNVKPTAYWHKGDRVPNRKNGLLRHETCWQFSNDYTPTLSFEEVSREFIGRLNSDLDLLSKYINNNNLESRLDVAIKIINGETPSLSIYKNLMDVMILLNGEIEIDLYVLDE